MSFSVLQAVYKGDNPLYLQQCFDSLSKQTLQPNEIILVKDGKISNELELVIKSWSSTLPLKVYGYSTNKGLAHALNYGIQYVSTDFIARVDSDDYCFPTRFEKQMDFLLSNPEVNICGTGINEFYTDKNGTQFTRNRFYPSYVDKNSKCLYKGTPLGHPTLMIKTDVLKKFMYSETTNMNEDIDLWFRLLENDYKIYNIQEPLLHFRITDGTFKRRSISKAIKEFQIYEKNLENFFSFSLKEIYPLLRLILRFCPYGLSKKIYMSNARAKLFSNKMAQVG